MFYHHYIFFNWYLSDQQIQIEQAFSLGLIAFLSAIIFILYIHVCFFPKKITNAADIPTFPPLIMLFSLSIGFLMGISNLYVLQIYELPEFLNIFRSNILGISIIIISLLLINFSIKVFIDNKEDPNPTTQSNVLITNGIYVYIRNPMYLALSLFQIGVGISLSFIHISIMTILTVMLLHYYVILREEQYLLELFGEDYRCYLKSSRRWI